MYLIGFPLRSLLLKSGRCFGFQALPYLAALNTRLAFIQHPWIHRKALKKKIPCGQPGRRKLGGTGERPPPLASEACPFHQDIFIH